MTYQLYTMGMEEKSTQERAEPQETNTLTTQSAQETTLSPDGGYGWVCATAAAVINGHSWGFNSAYAVFLAYYMDNEIFPGSSPMQYAFVGGLSLTYGIRPTMFVGVVLETASLVIASFATQLWHLFLTQGLLFGAGVGLLFIPTAAVVPQWFTTKRSLASGISLSGAGLGGAVYSLAAGAMISSLGLNWAFRILSIIAFTVNSSCIFLIRDRNTAIGINQGAFHITLLKRAEYQLLIGFGIFTMLGYFILIFSLADYSISIGLNSSQSSLIAALFNFGQAIGRPLVGYFSDSAGRINISCSMTLLAGILPLTVWVNAKGYWVLLFFSISEGLVAGSFWATISPLMTEVVGVMGGSSGLNMMWLALVLPSTFSAPIALLIVSGTNSYLGAQLLTGLAYVAAAVCIILLRGWKVISNEATAVSEHGNDNAQNTEDTMGSCLCRDISLQTKVYIYGRACGRKCRV
ncbi:unnamed protein product [Clonostachys byssicola]|uniref:Major facilitator superfamily (MFS) profile domain-containing protein n=1 Tax=Clonostachys byssicola TaxID=160290 RepID=A0A9N9XYB9_9HYPO|nr:unnamed protein product [Clonostachys byssicola]